MGSQIPSPSPPLTSAPSTVVLTAPTSSNAVTVTQFLMPSPAPETQVYIGEVTKSNSKYDYQAGFLADGTSDSPCEYVTIVPTGNNPCEYPFILPDGVTYTWHGCGGNTWITWGNGINLGTCSYQ